MGMIGVPYTEWETTQQLPCRTAPDPNIFSATEQTLISEAKKYCQTCPTTTQCLQLAQDWAKAVGIEPDGIWGGKTRGERALQTIQGTAQ